MIVTKYRAKHEAIAVAFGMDKSQDDLIAQGAYRSRNEVEPYPLKAVLPITTGGSVGVLGETAGDWERSSINTPPREHYKVTGIE
jgi:hypothetical protein